MHSLSLFVLLIATVTAMIPNEKLRRCCAHPAINQHCAQKYCNFQAVTAASVFPFIAECNLHGSTVGMIWDCVSSKHDHSECCRNQGVRDFCMPFCRANSMVPTDMIKFGGCVSEFDKARVCFRSYLKHNKSIRGD